MTTTAFNEPCGGCGAKLKSERCIGCMHETEDWQSKPGQANTTVSDERLAEMLAAIPRYANGSVRSAGWVARIPAPDIFSILTELSARRATADVTEAHQARQNAADARANFLTMQGSAAQLLKRAEKAEKALALMFDAYKGVYNCIRSDGTKYQDSDAKDAEQAARAALSQQAPE